MIENVYKEQVYIRICMYIYIYLYIWLSFLGRCHDNFMTPTLNRKVSKKATYSFRALRMMLGKKIHTCLFRMGFLGGSFTISLLENSHFRVGILKPAKASSTPVIFSSNISTFGLRYHSGC